MIREEPIHENSSSRECLGGLKIVMRKVLVWRPTLLLANLYWFFVAITLLIFLSGCSKTIEWKEEVALSNGQVIVIERETRHRPGGAELVRGTGWKPTQYIIRFRYPSNAQKPIEWRSTKKDAERGTWPEFPLVLDINTAADSVFIVTFHGLKGACFEYMRYIFQGGNWREDPLPEEFSPRAANLFLPAAAIDVPPYVSLQQKQKENANPRYRKRRTHVGPKQRDCRA